jgi:hypothetical protein
MALCVIILGKSPLAVEMEFCVESNFVGLCSGRAFQRTLPHIFIEIREYLRIILVL